MKKETVLVPENIKDLKAYVPGKTIAEVQQQYKPTRISKLASNENRLGRSAEVEKAIKNALTIVHDYPDPETKELRHAIAHKNNISKDRIVVGAGSESMLAGLCRSFFLNKQNLITSDATFIGVYVQAQIRGIQVKRIPLTQDYKCDVKGMVNAIDERTKMMYIANPNNPTGTYITKEEFEWLLESVPSDVLIIMDEAYYEYANAVEDYPNVLSYDYDNVIVLRTFSKGYGLAGFRVGYAIAASEIIHYLRKTRLAFEPGTLGQAAALAAYNDDQFLEKSMAIVDEGKQDLYDFFEEKEIKYTPSAANFVMIEFENEKEAIQITQQMLQKGVILRHLQGFGLPKCVRITIGLKDDMEHFKRSFNQLIY